MKNKLDLVLARNKQNKKRSLIAYLAAGYPKFSEQKKIISAIKEAGVDILELGVPFSDPIADGPTIQFASQQALKNGTTLKKILSWTKELQPLDLPIVLMSYMNPILRYGFDAFARDAERVGVTGVIIPDFIPEEGAVLSQTLKKRNIHLIYLVAPTTPADRTRLVSQRSSGFLYAVSVAGVTGARKKFTPKTTSWLKSLQNRSALPICVGFGISGPQQVKQLKSSVDGFIVGSKLIDLIRSNAPSKRKQVLASFVKTLAKECRYAN